MEVALGLKVPAAQGTHKVPELYAPTPQEKKVIFRIRLLLESATKTLPLLSTATPLGYLNEAPAPVPSANAYNPLPPNLRIVKPLR